MPRNKIQNATIYVQISYTGVWVNYTVKKPQKVVVLVDGA